MEDIEKLSKGDRVKADLISRPNYISGRYKTARIFGLDNLMDVKSNDTFFLDTLKVRADSADRIFAEAASQGKDLSDSTVLKDLGEEINALGRPIHRSETIMTVIFVSLQLMAYYGIAIGIWGLVFKKSFLVFGIYGFIAGFLISLLTTAPVIASQRTKERIKDMSFAAGSIWGNIAILIGVVGLIAFAVRFIFF